MLRLQRFTSLCSDLTTKLLMRLGQTNLTQPQLLKVAGKKAQKSFLSEQEKTEKKAEWFPKLLKTFLINLCLFAIMVFLKVIQKSLRAKRSKNGQENSKIIGLKSITASLQ